MPEPCYACEAASPDAPMRERIVRERGWRVGHDFNSSLEGWLIVAPLRHVRALHELTRAEAAAMGDLLHRASVALHEVTGCEKTYVMLFAEADGFEHLHLHVVPRLADHPEDRRGPKVFAFMHDDAAVSPERRDELALAIRAAWPS